MLQIETRKKILNFRRMKKFLLFLSLPLKLIIFHFHSGTCYLCLCFCKHSTRNVLREARVSAQNTQTQWNH